MVVYIYADTVCCVLLYCVVLYIGAGESLRDMYVSTSRTSIVPPQMVSNMSGNLFTSGPPPPSYQSGRYSSLGIGRYVDRLIDM